MPRNKCWTEEENMFISGVINQHGDQPRRWPSEVKAMIQERLKNRSTSGIYQQTLKIIKGRHNLDASSPEEQGFMRANGA